MTQNPWDPQGGESQTPPREGEGEGGFSFQDRRKVDPVTGEVREQPDAAAAPAAAEPAPADRAGPEASTQLAEVTADLQRLTAEYANYRKRVDRDRELNQDRAVARVVTDLMPILDDLDRARGHGEVEGGFKAVADAIEAVATKYGLTRFGEAGELFDPHVHEAMTSHPSPDVTEPTVQSVYQIGYRLKDQVLRPARVAVADAE